MTLISIIIIIIFFLQSQIKHFRLKSGEEMDWLGWGMRANGGQCCHTSSWVWRKMLCVRERPHLIRSLSGHGGFWDCGEKVGSTHARNGACSRSRLKLWASPINCNFP